MSHRSYNTGNATTGANGALGCNLHAPLRHWRIYPTVIVRGRSVWCKKCFQARCLQLEVLVGEIV